MFAGTGHFSSRVYVRMFHSTRDDFTRGDLQKTADNIIKPRRSVLHDKNCLALVGIPIERIVYKRIRFAGSGQKPSQQNSFNLNGTGQIRDIYTYGETPFNVPPPI